MQAVTVRPEYAFAMLSLGKRIENRGFTPQGLIGSRIALHVGKSVGGTPTKPSIARGFRELACDMVRCGYLAAPVWFKGEEPLLAWQPLGDTIRKSSHVLRDGDLLKSAIFATARLETFKGQVPAGYCPLWARPSFEWWVLEDFAPLPEPIPCRGQQGLWTVPEEIASKIREQEG